MVSGGRAGSDPIRLIFQIRCLFIFIGFIPTWKPIVGMASLSLADTLDIRPLVLISSLASYATFNRYEPSSMRSITLLLFVVPGLLVLPLHHFDSESNIARTTVAAFIAHWSLLVLLTVGYRLSPLHPLARFPGPIMCRISKGWLAYLTVKDKKAHLYIKDLHERYGDIVRIGPNELSVIPKDTAATVIGPKGLPRGPYYNSRAHEGGVSLDGIRDPSLHAARRKPWARGMNSTAMKYYEDVIREETTTLLRVLRERKSEKTDISEWMSFLSFDVMGRMSFSSDLGMLKHGRDDHGLLNLIEHAVTDAAWISHIPWIIPLLKYLPSASKSWEDMKVVGATLVKRRVQDGSTHPDLFHYLMDEDGNEPVKPSLEVCAGDGMLAIIAGSDTAATTLSHVWYCFLSHRECFNRLRSEIDEVFPHGEDPMSNLAKLAILPYLNACINEALRLYPPVLGALQRRIEPETGGIVIGDHFIPAETQVSLYAYAIHRDPRHFWPIPDQFWPDRWLSQEKYVLPSGDVIPLDQMVNNREVFVPFSAGPMVCAGKNVAMAEMRAVISSIVQQFDMKVEDQCSLSKWEGDIHEVFVTSRGSLPVFLEPRFG